MGILLAFAPFIVFVILERTAGVLPGLVAAALTSAALLVRDAISPNRAVKLLEVGTAVLFGGLAIYAAVAKPTWSIAAVRLRVDGGLLLIVIISILVRSPFTLQYAREQTPAEVWSRPEFVRVNYVITGVWAAAFAVMVAADLVMAYLPAVPTRTGIIATILALVGAIRFTSWYPNREQARA